MEIHQIGQLWMYLCIMQNSIKTLLKPLGIESLTPVQEEVLFKYERADEVIMYAPTGTGKTLAFLLPLIELLRKEKIENTTRALILSPTRELALQIEAVFKSLKTEFLISACYGGHSISSETNNLTAKPTIVVGTPGRLVDHIERENLDIKTIQFLVIDEFDKCLELGFHEQISSIYGETRDLRKLFFGSATKLNDFPVFLKLRNPVFIDQTEQDIQPEIQYFTLPILGDKFTTLKQFVTQFQKDRIIIFCNFREDADQISDFFNELNMAVACYHGGLLQDERERALIKFRNQSCPVLVCTDIGARGLDIPEVKHIVHYMLPDKEDAFIHRNGRTARMMENGCVYWFEQDTRKAKFDLPLGAVFSVESGNTYQPNDWITLYFSGGKKNKINKIDLIGFLCKQGDLPKESVGVITVLDFTSYVAVKTKNPRALLENLRRFKVKGQKLKIDIAY